MEKCPVSLLGGRINCREKPGLTCALMENEEVPDGDLSALSQAFKNLLADRLERYVRAHSLGGRWHNTCKASPQIVTAANEELERRRRPL